MHSYTKVLQHLLYVYCIEAVLLPCNTAVLQLHSKPQPIGTNQNAAAVAAAAATSGLGPVDGTLGSCAGIDPCSSSYDDRPPHFVAPWQFDGTQAVAVRDLADTLEVSSTWCMEPGSGVHIWMRICVGSECNAHDFATLVGDCRLVAQCLTMHCCSVHGSLTADSCAPAPAYQGHVQPAREIRHCSCAYTHLHCIEV
jgi:hypothetical protein